MIDEQAVRTAHPDAQVMTGGAGHRTLYRIEKRSGPRSQRSLGGWRKDQASAWKAAATKLRESKCDAEA